MGDEVVHVPISGAVVWTKGQRVVYDGKRMRKPVVRKTVDFNAGIIRNYSDRFFRRDYRDRPFLQPTFDSFKDMEAAYEYSDQPANAFCSRFVHTAVNKSKRPINCVVWTPEGRRLLTGSHSGEFTLWNGLQFNFETILQAHTDPIRCMIWSHDGDWMISTDDHGVIKYWQSTMNNVKTFNGHEAAVRGVSFSPTDAKFVTGSDDKMIKIWDFTTCQQELNLAGHGWDVKGVSWHPYKSLIVSGGKDNLIKLWDPRSGRELVTIPGHKNTVSRVVFNDNGNWFVSASRDHTIKIWDIRTFKDIQTCRGHSTEVTSLAWHPFYEDMLASGDFEGNVAFWIVGKQQPQGEILAAHDESAVWDMSWHPMGHILVTGSNDQTTRFWTRNKPGDELTDRYNCLGLPTEARNQAVLKLIEAARNTQGRAAILPPRIENYQVKVEEDAENVMTQEEIPGFGSAAQLKQRESEMKAPDRSSRSRTGERRGSESTHIKRDSPDDYSRGVRDDSRRRRGSFEERERPRDRDRRDRSREEPRERWMPPGPPPGWERHPPERMPMSGYPGYPPGGPPLGPYPDMRRDMNRPYPPGYMPSPLPPPGYRDPRMMPPRRDERYAR